MHLVGAPPSKSSYADPIQCFAHLRFPRLRMHTSCMEAQWRLVGLWCANPALAQRTSWVGNKRSTALSVGLVRNIRCGSDVLWRIQWHWSPRRKYYWVHRPDIAEISRTDIRQARKLYHDAYTRCGNWILVSKAKSKTDRNLEVRSKSRQEKQYCGIYTMLQGY